MVVQNLKNIFKPALLGAAVIGLSGCAYGVGGGYADGYYGDGYVNGGYANSYSRGYACDPYDPYDVYYSCDFGYGFANIGFGGGWYDNFYYPGYGLYVFDRRGYRHGMKKHHRRHWAKQRAEHGTRHARRGARGRDLTPEQRAERREGRAERQRDLTPEQRAERRERRQERRARRGAAGNSGLTTGAVPAGRATMRQGRMNDGGTRAGRRNGRSGTVSTPRISRPTGAVNRAQNARTPANVRPARVARPARQPAQAQTRRAAAPRPAPGVRPVTQSNDLGSARRQRDD